MPWTPKGSAPARFNLGAAVAALITGDATWAWLLDWLPLLPEVTIDTARMCAAGPVAVPAIDDSVFIGGDPALDIADAFLRLPRLYAALQALAQDRVFGAYCELLVGATVGCTTFYEGPRGAAVDGHPIASDPIPTGGALDVRVTAVSGVLSDHAVHFWQSNAGGDAIAELVPGGVHLGANGANTTVDIHAYAYIFLQDAGEDGVIWRVELCGHPAEVVDHTPTPQPQPAGAIPPTSGVYPDLAAVGKELDRQELKLDIVLGLLQLVVDRGIAGPTSAGPPHAAADGAVVSPSAIGYRLDVVGIPAGAGEMFGDPVKYHKIGRYTLGSADGWLSAVEIQHNPELVAPIPPGVDRILVVMNAPATCTITPLLPIKAPA